MILSHDLGTTGDKATLVSNHGVVVASHTAHYGTNFAAGGKAEQNPRDWWRAFCAATTELLARTGTAPADIDAISFSGQMMGVVPLDAAGALVRPAMIWADTRSSAQTARLLERIPMERAYAITGHRLNPTYSLSKLMWLRDEEPEAFSRIRHVVLPKDYLAHRLTGVIATEPSDASGTNAFDQRSGAWSDELLAAAGVAPKLLPELVPSSTVIGTVTADAAAEAGLTVGTPVVIGGGDGPLAALGAGITEPDCGTYAYLGSSSWVSTSSVAPLHDPAMRSMTFNHMIAGRFVPTATMQAGGASLQWIVETLAPASDDPYGELLDAASRAGGSHEGLYFLPHLLGERSPYWNPTARAAFLGLQRHHGRAELVRAVLEGVAFNLRTGLAAFAENGRDAASVDAIGGAAASPVVRRILANIWGVPVARRNLVEEAGALGAAILAGVGVGIFPDFEVARVLSVRDEPETPHPDEAARYDREYDLFMDAYRRLEGWFEALP